MVGEQPPSIRIPPPDSAVLLPVIVNPLRMVPSGQPEIVTTLSSPVPLIVVTPFPFTLLRIIALLIGKIMFSS